jgi:D-arginine dehydrogenase
VHEAEQEADEHQVPARRTRRRSLIRTADVVVIGGGIAGVSSASELSRDRGVLLVEQEPQLAHHTTGRSAAVFLESFGPRVVRALTVASRADFDAAPAALDTEPLLAPRPALWIAPGEQLAHMAAMQAEQPQLRTVDVDEALRSCAVLRREAFEAALVDETACDIDVLGLHQGYVRALMARGGEILRSWPVTGIEHRGDGWRLSTRDETVDCHDIVNAAGAWCDVVATLAGAAPLGLRPLRRTIAVCPAAGPVDPAWPLVCDVDHTFYWRPEGPNVLCSPADETPSVPCDARPEELDIALALERVNGTTTLGLRSVRSAWAGLRTFSPDGVPVAGEDPRCAGLWWCAGQGGYGIQSAPAMARTLRALMAGEPVPADVAVAGVTAEELAPTRFCNDAG